MVYVYNKSNRPIGVAGKAILPDKELALKDKEVYCDIYDEEGNPTGERQIIPGLKALEMNGVCNVKIEEEKKVEPKKVEPVEDEEAPKKATRSRTKKTAE